MNGLARLFCWLLIPAFWLAGPGRVEAAESGGLRIVTTILPAYCFVAGVAGSAAQVENLLPPNVGPHDYQLSPGDLRRIREADLIVSNGLGLENWLAKAFKAGGRARQLELGKFLDKELIHESTHLDLGGGHDHAHEHHHAGPNPHFWLDPRLAMQAVTNILSVLQEMDPARAEAYAANAAAYLERLRMLDKTIAERLEPLKARPFITFHDAFPYFVRRYDLKLAGVLESVPDVSPSPRYLADLLRVVRERKVGVIFTEPQFPSRLARQIARDAKIRVATLDTLETGRFHPKAYEEGMLRNVETLAVELKE